MAFGSFGAGLLPLSMSLPSDKLKLLSTFGSGLLIGTALAVILPEGVATLYAASSVLPQMPQNKLETASSSNKSKLLPRHSPSEGHLAGLSTTATSRPNNNNNDMPLEQVLGLSLTFGFAFMFLVDYLSSANHSTHTKIAVSELSENGGLMMDSRRKTSSATIGLIIHSAADGVALGAASMSGNS